MYCVCVFCYFLLMLFVFVRVMCFCFIFFYSFLLVKWYRFLINCWVFGLKMFMFIRLWNVGIGGCFIQQAWKQLKFVGLIGLFLYWVFIWYFNFIISILLLCLILVIFWYSLIGMLVFCLISLVFCLQFIQFFSWLWLQAVIIFWKNVGVFMACRW